MLQEIIFWIDSAVYRYVEFAPFQRYPVELCVISLSMFLIALWVVGKQMNQDIATQLAIPLMKQMHDMGFSQNPGFNTITHSMQRGYLHLPSPLVSKKGPTPGEPAQYLSEDQIWDFVWPESYSSYQLYATGHPNLNGIHCHVNTIPRHDIFLFLASFLGITPGQDTLTIRIALQNIDPFFWSFVRDKKLADQLTDDVSQPADGHSTHNSPTVDDRSDGDGDGDSDGDGNSEICAISDSNQDNDDSTSLFSTSFHHRNPQSNNQHNKHSNNNMNSTPNNTPTPAQQRIGKVIDLVGLPLTNVLFCPKHVIMSDTPELLLNQSISPFPDDILTFFSKLDTSTQNVFEFQSLTCTDQNDGYDVVNLHDIPIPIPTTAPTTTTTPTTPTNPDKNLISKLSTIPSHLYNDNEIPKEEESAFLTLTLTFNSLNIPLSPNQSNDPTNQVFVNQCLDSVCLQLFMLSQLLTTYKLPDYIHKRNIDQRDRYDPANTITPMTDEAEEKQNRREHRLARDGLSNRIIGTAGFSHKQQKKGKEGKSKTKKAD